MYIKCELRHLILLSFILSSNAFGLVPLITSGVNTYQKTAIRTWIPPPSLERPITNRQCYLLQQTSHRISNTKRPVIRLRQQSTEEDDTVDDTASKWIVSLLTDIVNSVFDTWSVVFPRTVTWQDGIRNVTTTSDCGTTDARVVMVQSSQPPSSAMELLERIRDDYTVHNYLWTGDLNVEANFVKSCRFTDPTLTFVGTDQYMKNIQNLRPILNLVMNVATECRSELLDIQLCESYIQTRWNMIGSLSRVPWKPKVNVIGQTKFWFHNDTYQIYLYDEEWEIQANQALLQLVTPTN